MSLPAHENPFRVSRLERLRFRYPAGWDLERLLARLEALGGRAAVVGPHGSGKSTLLAELGRALAGRGWRVTLLRLEGAGAARPLALGRAATCGPHDALLLDGAGALGALAWRRIRRAASRAGVLVITAHRPGRLPTLLRLATSPELLAEIVAELAPGLAPGLAPELPALHARHGGDLHAALLELYDRAAGR